MKLTILLIFCIGLCYGATWIEQTNAEPGYCESSYYKIGRMELGKKVTIKKKCIEVDCGENGVITYASCGAMPQKQNCKKIPGNNGTNYPKCCPRYKCDDTKTKYDDDDLD